jgi:hypothetical protein
MQHPKSSSFTRPTDVGKLKSFQSRWCPTRLTAEEIVLHKQKRPRSPSQYDEILPNSSRHHLGVWRGITWTSPKNKVMVYCTASDMENNIPQNREWSQGASWWLYCIASDNGCDVQRNLWFQRASLVRYHIEARLWLLHRFGRWVRYATEFRSLIAIIQCEDILNVPKCLGNWVRCATRQCCGEMFSLNLPRETLIVRENFEHLDVVLQILETDFSQRYSLRTKKTRSDETCDRWYLWSEEIWAWMRPICDIGRNTTGNKSSGVDS